MSHFFVQSFNTLLKHLSSELAESYDDKPYVPEFNAFMQALPIDSDIAISIFSSSMEQYGELIMGNDNSVYSKIKINVPNLGVSVDLNDIWSDPDTDDETRDMLKQYLQTLYSLSLTYSKVPKEMIAVIESMSKEVVDKIKNEEMDMTMLIPHIMSQMQGLFGNDSDIDQASIMNLMNTMLGQCSGDGMNLAALLKHT